jgi:hypothetical protein
MRYLIGLISVLLVAGCASIKEDHYFTSVTKEGERARNYFRLKVRGSAQLSSARYVAGFYDERAVDLFFNELKTADSSSKLFADAVKSPGSNEVIKSLDSSKRGAFVMILSTNADAVAATIGSFAESGVAAEAITNLVNQSRIREARRTDAMLTVQQNRAIAAAGQINELFNQVPADGNKAVTEEAYLRVLNALGAALGARQHFESIGEAENWFRAARELLED